MDIWVRRLGFLLAGLTALAGALWLQTRFAGLQPPYRQALWLLPPLLAAAGVGLGLWFHRDRAVFLHLILAGAYLLPQVLRPGGVAGAVLFDGLSLLLPVNFLVFGVLTDRGLASRAAMARGAWLGGQVLVLAIAVVGPLTPLAERVAQAPLAPGTALGAASAATLGLAVLAVAGIGLRRRDPMAGGILAAVAGTGWALHTGGEVGSVVAGWGLAHLGLAVAQVQESYRLAFIDSLTGLPGRRALEEQLSRMGPDYAAAMVDVDHFKRFNDRHGHAAGDQVLRMVAQRLARIGAGGRAFRYGGEEFAVLFPGRDAQQAAAAMDRVRQAVAAVPFRLRQGRRDPGRRGSGGGRGANVTVSVGVADCGKPDPPLARADKALYRAKRQGRNRVCR